MEVYFDNSATTRVDENVIELMAKVMRLDYGNPSSKHLKGVESEKYLVHAQEALAKILKVSPKEIFFTSGGTESNNTAVIGAAMANKRRGRHLITTQIEHDSVLEAFRYLEEMKLPENIDPQGKGFEVTYLKPDGAGRVKPEDLRAALRDDTSLVSVMMVNNEVGSVQEIAQMGHIIKERNPACLFHVDAVQAFGKYEIFPKRMNTDLLSISAHKIHGPKGSGALYMREGARVNPLILGGGQQKGFRSGTDNVPGAAGLALAAENAYASLKEDTQRMMQIKDYLADELIRLCAAGEFGKCTVKINSQKGTAGAPHILSASFVPVKSEVLLHALEDKGIYVSAGSACASNRKRGSHVLSAIGLDAKTADCTLRFSFCRDNTRQEADYLLECLKDLLPVLSRFTAH